jgi:hypothetical protein
MSDVDAPLLGLVAMCPPHQQCTAWVADVARSALAGITKVFVEAHVH